MILRHDDPLVASLRSLGEPVYVLDSNPTVERIARLLFDVSREQGLAGRACHGMGDSELVGNLPSLIAFDLDGTLIDSQRDLAQSANQLIVELGGDPLAEEAIGGMVGEGAALLVKRALAAAGLEHSSSALDRFLEIYDTRLVNHTRLYDGILDALRLARRTRTSECSPTSRRVQRRSSSMRSGSPICSRA
jgi:hypothetical protein